MVLLNGNKYACETCIKGHRSSTCRHTDRPLFEIKKKGRPITQCEHCRQLRKSKQVHIKCVCEGKEDNLPKEMPGIKKGHTLIPGSAAFPQGLPEALGASVALPAVPSSSRPSSVSDTGGSNPHCCTDDTCKCWVPRKHAPRRKSKKSEASPPVPVAPGTGALSDPENNAPAASHILARLAELRPVLPRPATTGPAHDPSSGVAHSHARHHGHENSFSPYGRAYDFSRETNLAGEPGGDQPLLPQDAFSIPQPNSHSIPPSNDTAISSEELMLREQLRALEEVMASSNVPPGQTLTNPEFFQQNPDLSTFIPSFPSSCNCGDGCLCPGCFQHNAKNAASIPLSSAFSSCMNPGQCTSCLDCTILSLPASLPADTSLSIYNASGAQSIDDWIRQMSQLPPDSTQIQTDISSPSSTPSPVSEDGHIKQTPRLFNPLPVPPVPQSQPSQSGSDWEEFLRENRLPPVTGPLRVGAYTVQSCCGVLCKCDPEECQCEIDREDGYDCRQEMLFPSEPSMTRSGYDGGQAPVLGEPLNGMMRSYSDPADNVYRQPRPGADSSDYLIVPSSRTRSSSASSTSHPPTGSMDMGQLNSPFDYQDHIMGDVGQECSHNRGPVHQQSQPVMSMSTPNLPAMIDARMDFISTSMDVNMDVVPSMRTRGSSMSIPRHSFVYSPPGSRSVSPRSASSPNGPLQMPTFGSRATGGQFGEVPPGPYAMSMASDSDTDGYASDRFAGETGLW